MTSPVFVVLFRRWNSRERRWTTQIGHTSERPWSREGYLHVYEVEGCKRSSEAPGVVMEWLARSRPADMSVREILT